MGTYGVVELLILAIPVATVAWTVTHEEVFREFREWVQRKGAEADTLLGRKFAYLFTCEFCFSFYVSLGALLLTGFHLLYPGWQGLGVAWLALVWIANIYMSLYARLRLDVKKERVELASRENEVHEAHGIATARK